MKVTTITSSSSIPLKIGPREYIKSFFSMSADIEDGDDLEQCSRELYKLTYKEMLKNAILDMNAVRQHRDDDPKDVLSSMKQVKKMLKEIK